MSVGLRQLPAILLTLLAFLALSSLLNPISLMCSASYAFNLVVLLPLLIFLLPHSPSQALVAERVRQEELLQERIRAIEVRDPCQLALRGASSEFDMR